MLCRRLLVSVIGFLITFYTALSIALHQEPSSEVGGASVSAGGTKRLAKKTFGVKDSISSVRQEKLAMHLYQRDIPFANEQSLAITRDSLGYYWLGTGLGLIRYDGNESQRVMSNASGDATGSVVIRLLEHNGYIWAGTAAQGLFRVDLSDHQIKHYPKGEGISHGYVTGLIEDQYQRFWVLTIDGLNLYDPKTDGFQQFFIPRRAAVTSSPTYSFKTLVALDRDTVLISSFARGVQIFDVRTGTFKAATDSSLQISDEGFKVHLSKPGGELLKTGADRFVYGVNNRLFEFDRTGYLIRSTGFSPKRSTIQLKINRM